MRTTSHGLWRFVAIVALSAGAVAVRGQTGALNGEWRAYGGDTGHTRYSPLDQIDAGNFSKLIVAWRFKTDHLGPRPEFMFEATPVMANGVLYTTAGSRRAVVALDPETGEELWMHSEREGPRGDGGTKTTCPAAGSPTGPTEKRNESSTSRRATASSR